MFDLGRDTVQSDYALPDTVQSDYYTHRFRFDELLTLLELRPDKSTYLYRMLESTQREKFEWIKGRRTNNIWFSYADLKIRIHFNPKLRSLDDIDRELEGFPSNIRPCVMELMNEFRWVIETVEPKQPTDFIWYI